MRPALFITGTDTNVGKTVVSAIIARGWKADYWKPVQTGTVEGSDSHFVRDWAGSSRIYQEAFALPRPVSPHVAARDAGLRIGVRDLLPRAHAICSQDSSPLIIEGAGGVFVPLNEQELMIDFIAALHLKTLVVGRAGLGSINHTLLTLQALKLRDIAIAAVVLVGEDTVETLSSIRERVEVPVLGCIAHIREFSGGWMDRVYEETFKETFKESEVSL